MGQEETNAKLEQPVTSKPAENTQKSKTCLLTSILLAILAVGGIAFGVYGMILANQPHKCPTVNYNVNENSDSETTDTIEVTCPDGTVTKVEKIIDNDLAQNLIRPYMKAFNYLANMLDYSFNDDAKIVIAFQNSLIDGWTPIYTPSQGNVYTLSYDYLNSKYQELFGSTSSLEEKNYNPSHGYNFTYYNDGWPKFEIVPIDAGGTGLGMFNVVKSANYNDGKLTVEVYHDSIPTCIVDNNDGYCIDVDSMNALIDSIDDFNMRDLIANFSDRIPVYTMTFAKDNGHYVLINVEKQ